MIDWANNILDLKTTLSSLSVLDFSGKEIEPDLAFVLWRDITCRVRENRKTVYLIGNGASASMASHISADLAKNAHIHTEVFSDLSLITAIANDLSYEDVFGEPLRHRMVPGDMLVAISSSGQSPNVIHGVLEANKLGGFVVTLSAMAPGNSLRSGGILNFYVPAEGYGIAETCHGAILHYWVDMILSMPLEIFTWNESNKIERASETLE